MFVQKNIIGKLENLSEHKGSFKLENKEAWGFRICNFVHNFDLEKNSS